MYIFSGLYYVTDHGTDIELAQYIFAALYIVFLSLVMYLYVKAKVCADECPDALLLKWMAPSLYSANANYTVYRSAE